MTPGKAVIFHKYRYSYGAPKKLPAVVVKVENVKALILIQGRSKPCWVLIENLSEAR